MSKVAIAVVLCAVTAAAQNPRFAQVGDPFPDGIGQAFGAADFEGDGDVDLYTTNGVFLNTLGFFSPGPKMPAGFASTINIYSIAVAEANGDGRPDIFVGGGGGPTSIPIGISLFVAPPAGGAQFTVAAGAFTNATLMNKFAVADFDGDGDVDVIGAATSTANPQWQLFLNNGAGIFGSAPIAQWPFGQIAASWVGAGDFDGDGDMDVVASSSTGAVWRQNLGAGVFGPTIVLGSALIADSGAIGDFDGDGDDDVFVVAVNGNEAIHPGSPAGLAAGPSTFGGILGPPPVAFDIEGDGDADVIRTVVQVSGSASGPLQVRLGSPAGLGPAVTVMAQATFGLGNPGPYPGIASLDVEGDGDTDIALVTGSGAPALVLNGGVNGFVIVPHPVPFGLGTLYAPPRDVDGDGDADLIRGVAMGFVGLTVSKNDGRGNFAEPVPAGSYPGFVGRAVWADLDLDGDSDLWVTSYATAAATALVNDGTGFFTPVASFPLTGPVGALAAADFDGDADIDIVMGRGISGTFPPTFHQPVLIRNLFTQSGIVSFMPPGAFGALEAIRDLAVFDAEPDGDLDLLAGTFGLGGVPATPRLFINDGTGGFGTSFSIAGAVALTVAAADLNGDNVVDAVLGGQVWMASGGILVPASSHVPPIDLISLADLDLDGTLDLLDSAGRWYPGSAGGVFGAPLNIVPFIPAAPFAIAPPKPAPVDLDGDGDLDLAGADNLFGVSASIYSNLTRHAGRTSLVSQNSTVSLAVWGAPSAPWLLAASVPGAVPQQLPPFGTLFLDPATLVILASGNIPAGGRSNVSGFLGPGLPGLTTSWQALVGGSLTNAFDTIVLP